MTREKHEDVLPGSASLALVQKKMSQILCLQQGRNHALCLRALVQYCGQPPRADPIGRAHCDGGKVNFPDRMVGGVQSCQSGLAVPLGPDRVNKIDGQDEAAEAEQDPENALGPVTPVLGDVTQAM